MTPDDFNDNDEKRRFVAEHQQSTPAGLLLTVLIAFVWAIGLGLKAGGILPQSWIWILLWPVFATLLVFAAIGMVVFTDHIGWYVKKKIKRR